jgi:DNA-binding response OmpR family regulator
MRVAKFCLPPLPAMARVLHDASVTNPRSILLVEDDRSVRATLAAGIRDAGYQVEEAESGEDALMLMQQQPPDLALIDVCLPGMSGIELARRLREGTQVPFLFLSGESDLELVKQAVDCGALGYMVKPMDAAQVIPGIESALRRAGEIRQMQERETQLNSAVNQGRETSMAIGLLMERLHTDRKSAFEALRAYARSQQRKISDVAGELLDAAEKRIAPQPGRDPGSGLDSPAAPDPLPAPGKKS